MNTPKKMKKLSKMPSLKQFLISILATSVSIALTFGTAAIIDYNAKQKSKREIVMMVMYDMYNSLESIQKADSTILQAMDVQLQIAEDTTKFETLQYKFALLMPKAEYTETTERIFSSSIETINTVGNVLFTENVSEFYQLRQVYKTTVSDSLFHEIYQNTPFFTIKGTLEFRYSYYALLSSAFLQDMKFRYDQCKQMMKITDEEIEVYRKEREQIEKGKSRYDEASDSIFQELILMQNSINESKEKLNLE